MSIESPSFKEMGRESESEKDISQLSLEQATREQGPRAETERQKIIEFLETMSGSIESAQKEANPDSRQATLSIDLKDIPSTHALELLLGAAKGTWTWKDTEMRGGWESGDNKEVEVVQREYQSNIPDITVTEKLRKLARGYSTIGEYLIVNYRASQGLTRDKFFRTVRENIMQGHTQEEVKEAMRSNPLLRALELKEKLQ